MTGSALFDFLITIVGLGLIAALFFVVIDRIAPDPTFSRIAKIAIGGVCLIVLLLACKAVLFGGAGGGFNAHGLVAFAIGAIVVLIFLYLVDLVLQYFAAAAGLAPFVTAIKYVIAGIALIALLVLADRALFGGSYTGSALTGPLFGETPRISR